MKILVTGFDPFGGESLNPAWEAVKTLPDTIEDKIIFKRQIPTVFRDSIEVLLQHINELKPNIVLCVGQAGGRFDLSIERIGINIDDARIKDNKNQQPVDEPIYQDGENAYFVHLPIKQMMDQVRNAGIPCSISNTAGTFVCNHILYGLLYHIEKYQVAKAGGFVHVPYTPAQVIQKPNQASMSIPMIAQGLTEMIRTINDKEQKIPAGKEC
ncbi:MAG: pyroglutamyl-peptidase I [Brevinema sp.]